MTTRKPQSLTSRQLAQAMGVSESSVKRWIDDGEIAAYRTSGGHRRVPVAEAVSFIRRQRAALLRPELLALPAEPAPGAIDEETASQLHQALMQDDAAQARAIVTGRFLAGADVASIGDQLLKPALEQIGELWLADHPHALPGGEGVLVEHRAVQTCLQSLTDLLAWLPLPPPHAPVAISAGGPADPYLLPPLLTAMTLQENGFRAINLGASTPLGTLALAADRYQASLCSLSISSSLPFAQPSSAASRPQDRRSHWVEFADTLQAAEVTLIVGGRCAASLPSQLLKRVQRFATLAELGTFAAGVAQGIRAGRQGTPAPESD